MKKPARRLSKLTFPTSPTAIRTDFLMYVTGGGEVERCWRTVDPCWLTINPCWRTIVPCVRTP